MKLLTKILEQKEIKEYIDINKSESLDYVINNFKMNKLQNYIIENISKFIVEDDLNSSYNKIKSFVINEIWSSLISGTQTASLIGTDIGVTAGLDKMRESNPMIYSYSQGGFDLATLVASGTKSIATSSVFIHPLESLATAAATFSTEIGMVSGSTIFGSLFLSGSLGWNTGNVLNTIPGFQDHIMRFIVDDIKLNSNTGLGLGWNLDKIHKAYNYGDEFTQKAAKNIFDFFTKSDMIRHGIHLHNVKRETDISSPVTPIGATAKIIDTAINFNSNFKKLSAEVLDFAENSKNLDIIKKLETYKSGTIAKHVAEKAENAINKANLPSQAKSAWDSVKDFAYDYPRFYVPIIILGICGIIFKFRIKL
ncbi:MAG: hypothetical protein IPH62_19630 [Ignavibacteriae bacterium]|nr:hypothetical protein [Ignavibacteriota bacterium]